MEKGLDKFEFILKYLPSICALLWEDEKFRKKFGIKEVNLREIIDKVLKKGKKITNAFCNEFLRKRAMIMRKKIMLLVYLRKACAFKVKNKIIIGKIVCILDDCAIIEEYNGTWCSVYLLFLSLIANSETN